MHEMIARQRRGELPKCVHVLAHRIVSEIPGLGVPEVAGTTLYLMARYGPGQGAIVEIGSGFGRSACFLAAGSRDAKRERVWCVDPHTGGKLYLEQAGVDRIDSYPTFLANVRRLGYDDYVHPLVMTSEEAAKWWESPIRLLFIDGWHPDCRLDIELWFPFLVPGGVIVFDDYFHPRCPEVRAGVDWMMRELPVEKPLQSLGRLVWTFKDEDQIH